MIITSNTSAVAERGRSGEARKAGRQAGEGRNGTGAAKRMKKHEGEARGATLADTTAALPEENSTAAKV